MGDYYGIPTRRLSNDFLELECLESAGPRIVGLRFRGSDNLLAEVPELKQTTPYGDFHFMGGHRLWHAPEVLPRTYVPDDDGCTFTELPQGALLTGKLEEGTGIRKSIEIKIDTAFPRIDLLHTLVNEGSWDVSLAPWAITQFRLGGLVTLPVRSENAAHIGLLPDRPFVLWPYTKIQDLRLKITDDHIQIDAQPASPLKIGVFNPCGWITYQIDGILFKMSFAVNSGLQHVDYGCNAECYSGPEFVELESLGPLSLLAVGQKLQWSETWELYSV